MVQIIDDPYFRGGFGSVGAGVGQGFGEGLAKSIPEEIDRYRLRQGLKKLARNKDLTPEESIAEMYSLPGMTPSIIEHGTKVFQEGARRNWAEKEAKKDEEPNTQEKPIIPKEKPQTEHELYQKKYDEETNKTINKINKGGSYLESLTPAMAALAYQGPLNYQERQKQIAEIKREAPFINYDQADQMVTQRYNSIQGSVQDAQARGVREKQTKNDFIDLYRNQLGKTIGPMYDANGNIVKDINLTNRQEKAFDDYADQKLKNAILNGKEGSLKDVADEVVKDAQSIARSNQRLNEIANSSIIDMGWKKTKNDLLSMQPKYAKFGLQEDYRDMITQKLKISTPFASWYSNPIKNNPEIANHLKKVKSSGNIKIFQIFSNEKHNRTINDFINNLKENIKPTDSIQGLLGYMHMKGYNYNDVKSQIKADPILMKYLNKRQIDELDYTLPNLDINAEWLQTLGGVPEL